MIETNRLIIKPLTYEQLTQYIQNDPALEAGLNVKPGNRTISPDLKEAFEKEILPNVADPTKNYLFSTLWTIILKDENRMAGDLCFVGEPNADGEVEVGYGTHDEFQGRGIMTEALQGLILWARKQPGVKAIVASTEKSNAASSAVLKKNGFIQCGEEGELWQWKRELRST